MFTGIVQAVGKIVRVSPLEIQCPRLDLAGVGVGASIAVQGVCLTVTSLARLAAGARVNLEIDLIARYVERLLAQSRT